MPSSSATAPYGGSVPSDSEWELQQQDEDEFEFMSLVQQQQSAAMERQQQQQQLDAVYQQEEQSNGGSNSRNSSSDANAAMMLHCLFAMVFAAATLGLMNCLGFVVRSNACCPVRSNVEYSACEMWQDFRSVLSFLFGALLCCLITSERKNAVAGGGDSAGKVQLYTCLL